MWKSVQNVDKSIEIDFRSKIRWHGITSDSSADKAAKRKDQDLKED